MHEYKSFNCKFYEYFLSLSINIPTSGISTEEKFDNFFFNVDWCSQHGLVQMWFKCKEFKKKSVWESVKIPGLFESTEFGRIGGIIREPLFDAIISLRAEKISYNKTKNEKQMGQKIKLL